MANTTVAVTAGSGTLLRHNSRTISSNTVLEQHVQLADYHEATYNVVTAATAITTAASHTVQIMAGGTLPVYLRRIRVFQIVAVTTGVIVNWDVLRLTTAGTGGTAVTPSPLDSTDSASGCTAMTLPTAKGTESTVLYRASSQIIQTVGAIGPGQNPLLLDLNFDDLRIKVPRIAAGTSNGIALKQVTGASPATVYVVATVTEASY